MSLANAMIRQPTSAIAWANMTPLIQKCFFCFVFWKTNTFWFLDGAYAIQQHRTTNLFCSNAFPIHADERADTPQITLKSPQRNFFGHPKKKRKKKPAAGLWRKTIEIQRNPQCLRATKILTRTNRLVPQMPMALGQKKGVQRNTIIKVELRYGFFIKKYCVALRAGLFSWRASYSICQNPKCPCTTFFVAR